MTSIDQAVAPTSHEVTGGRDAATGDPVPHAESAPASHVFDSTQAWQLNPKVALRPEPFGALLYHFGTRKLSFLKNRTIVEVVQSLDDHPDARSALRAAGIEVTQTPTGLLAATEAATVGRVALDARIVLTDLAAGSAGGLEELFLTLTASESREGIAA